MKQLLMNILFLADYVFEDHPGGSRVVARELARGLAARGHAVTFLVRAKEGQPASDTTENDARVVRYAVPPGGARAYIRAGRDACACLLRSEKFDIAHTHFAYSAVGPLAVLPPQIQHIRSFYGPWHDEGYVEDKQNGRGPRAYAVRQARFLLRRRIERQNLTRSRTVLVLSEHSRREVLGLRFPAGRITLVPGGADTDRFRPAPKAATRAALGLPPDGPLLLSIRRLAPRMGLDTLLAAMPAILRVCPAAHLLIGGTGPEEARLRQTIRSLGLGNAVRLLGFIPDDQLAAYYQAADLFVLPTQALEGFGLVTAESLACGTPVLGTPVGAIPELLAPLDPRLIARTADPAGLAEAVTAFLSQDWRLALTPDRLRAYVLGRYTWDRHTAQTEQVYAALLPPGT